MQRDALLRNPKYSLARPPTTMDLVMLYDRPNKDTS